MLCSCRRNTFPPTCYTGRCGQATSGAPPPKPPVPGTVLSSSGPPMAMFAELGDGQRTHVAPSAGPGTPRQGKMLRTQGLSLFFSPPNNPRGFHLSLSSW
ncbi:unnamed protein product [Gulo gulo]|uniref:Uncharacterized protein n=1 Tax=Gulo gulo TaxID=48420 RepID=A0A9X9LYM0_GULGU|nr:unnamed protein product [Gulo gulo]